MCSPLSGRSLYHCCRPSCVPQRELHLSDNERPCDAQVHLLIMVDGVHHFKDSCHGRTAEQQRASDKRFDIAVLDADRRCASA